MPLLLSKKIDESAAYAVWKISETNSQLQALHDEEASQDYHRNKIGEWLATRILIKLLCQKFGIGYHGIKKDENGKPFLIDSKAQISLSHSFPVASAMLHTSKPCGIDVEWPRQKMQRIQDKFLNPAESKYRGDLTALCTIWAAKEAIYKRYGKRNLSLKDHILIDLQEDSISGQILKKNEITDVPLSMEKLKQYILVYSR